jgi:hypothetical protein
MPVPQAALDRCFVIANKNEPDSPYISELATDVPVLEMMSYMMQLYNSLQNQSFHRGALCAYPTDFKPFLLKTVSRAHPATFGGRY